MWLELFSLVPSAINNAPSPQRAGAPLVTAMTAIASFPPISTLYRSRSQTPVMVTKFAREGAVSTERLPKLVGDLHTLVQDALQKNQCQARELISKGKLPNFTQGDSLLVA